MNQRVYAGDFGSQVVITLTDGIQVKAKKILIIGTDGKKRSVRQFTQDENKVTFTVDSQWIKEPGLLRMRVVSSEDLMTPELTLAVSERSRVFPPMTTPVNNAQEIEDEYFIID